MWMTPKKIDLKIIFIIISPYNSFSNKKHNTSHIMLTITPW
jgi:hypothetical protein